MPLNQSKPPLSFLLYSSFAFFCLCSSLLPWVTGVRQTCCAQVCAFVQACLCASVQMNARVGVQQHHRMCVSFDLYVRVCIFMSVAYVWLCALGFLSPVSLLFHGFHREAAPAWDFSFFAFYIHTDA